MSLSYSPFWQRSGRKRSSSSRRPSCALSVVATSFAADAVSVVAAVRVVEAAATAPVLAAVLLPHNCSSECCRTCAITVSCCSPEARANCFAVLAARGAVGLGLQWTQQYHTSLLDSNDGIVHQVGPHVRASTVLELINCAPALQARGRPATAAGRA